MEHRWAERKDVELDVVLNYRGLGLVQGRTRNISMGGMFVETGCIRLPVDALLETSFLLTRENDFRRSCETQAMVVHSDELGAGLMFNELDEGFCEILKQLMVK